MASDASASSSKQIKEESQHQTAATAPRFPDDVMEHILSFLPIKKAVSCGLISKRFLNTWRFSRDLYFDIDIRHLGNSFAIINHVMDGHSAPAIERLRVINLDPSGKENSVLNWIRKAIAKRVQELDLDFSAGTSPFLLPWEVVDVFHYVGEIHRITLKSEAANLVEAVLHFNPPPGFNLFPGVENLMVALRSMKCLSISRNLLERLSARFSDFENQDIQCCLWNLREMHLCLDATTSSRQSNYMNPYDICFVLSKSPHIKKLTVDFGVSPLESGPYREFLTKFKFENSPFKFLKIVRFLNLKFHDLETQMLKFIITYADVLDHCIIVNAKQYRRGKEEEETLLRWLAGQKPKTKMYELNDYKPLLFLEEREVPSLDL